MSEDEYFKALLAKLLEEASEVINADSQSLVSELADLYEVIEAILAATGIPEEVVRQEQRKKQVERGGFESKIRLLWVE